MEDKLTKDSIVQIDYNNDGESVRYTQFRGTESVELSLQKPIMRPLPLEKFDALVELARAELKAAREQTDLDILNLTNDPRAIHSAFRMLIDGLNERWTPPSRLRKAGQFLAAWRMLELNLRRQYVGGDTLDEEEAAEKTAAARMHAACYFADAWHHWCREASGDHIEQTKGHRATLGSINGSMKRSAAPQKRYDIVANAVGDVIDGDSKNYQIAVEWIKIINGRLAAGGEMQYPKLSRA